MISYLKVLFYHDILYYINMLLIQSKCSPGNEVSNRQDSAIFGQTKIWKNASFMKECLPGKDLSNRDVCLIEQRRSNRDEIIIIQIFKANKHKWVADLTKMQAMCQTNKRHLKIQVDWLQKTGKNSRSKRKPRLSLTQSSLPLAPSAKIVKCLQQVKDWVG